MSNSSLVKWVCAENERGSNSIPKLRINRGIKFTNETRKYLTKTETIPRAGYTVAADPSILEMGTKVEVEVRGRRVEAEIVRLHFYKK